MFCDNPKCKLHEFDDQDKVETFETNVNYFMTGGPASGTVTHSNQRMVDQVTQARYNLCDVCVGVISKVIEMRTAHANLTPLQKAVAETTNKEEHEDNKNN